MNGIINDSLNYSGQVTCKIKIGNKIINKVIHNNGTMQLKRAFAMFMCGGTVAKEALRYIPSRVDLLYSEDNWLKSDTYLNRTVLATNPNYGKDTTSSEDSWYVEYTAVIPYSALRDKINLSYKYRLYLMCEEIARDDENNYLAFIDVSAADLAVLEAGVSFILSWRLKLLNSEPSN